MYPLNQNYNIGVNGEIKRENSFLVKDHNSDVSICLNWIDVTYY